MKRDKIFIYKIMKDKNTSNRHNKVKISKFNLIKTLH